MEIESLSSADMSARALETGFARRSCCGLNFKRNLLSYLLCRKSVRLSMGAKDIVEFIAIKYKGYTYTIVYNFGVARPSLHAEICENDLHFNCQVQ